MSFIATASDISLWFRTPANIVGLSLAVVGFAVMIASRPVGKKISGTKSGRAETIMKVAGWLTVIIGAVLTAI